MRRIKMVLAVAAAMAVMVTAGVAPAMPNNKTNNNDRHVGRVDVRLDKQLLNNNNDGFEFSPFFFDHSCPF